jgi:hypothetical protein
MRMPEYRGHVRTANDYESGASWIKGILFRREAARILASRRRIMQLAELTEVETGIVYAFNANKIYAIVRQPIPLVIDDRPAWGDIGTFVYGIQYGLHIAEKPEAFLERLGIEKEFVHFGEARCESKPIELWLRASAVSYLSSDFFQPQRDVHCYAHPGILRDSPFGLLQSPNEARALLESAA